MIQATLLLAAVTGVGALIRYEAILTLRLARAVRDWWLDGPPSPFGRA
jgi:hypothetical protein